jgi:chloride channel protein, CIC family
MRVKTGFIFRSNAPLRWIQHTLQPKQFLIFSAILVGFTAGLAAVILKLSVHFIAGHIGKWSGNNQYIIALCPLIGISLCSLYVFYLNRNRLGKGMVNILHAIARKSSYLPKDQVYSHIASSAFTVGFGGSVGLESPIVTTGAAIGSNYARAYKLSYRERTLLLACGAAAGIAGAFNTPIAGVLFALEVLLVEANITAFIPLLIAGATGALCSKVILHEEVLLHFRLREPFNSSNTFFYFLLAIFCGVVSFYYSRTFLATENLFKRTNSRVVKSIVSGCGLFLMVLMLPPLFGEGYNSIKSLSEYDPREVFAHSVFSSWLPGMGFFVLLLLVILIKPVAVALTLGGGGNGGNFAPSLFAGAFTGYFFSAFLNALGFTDLPVSNFTLVAMAGMLSGIFHAPLTGIFIIAEITGGYELIIPLMIVSAISFAVARYFMPLSIDLFKLSEKEKIIVTDTDSYLLSNIELNTFIENDFSEVPYEATLGEMVQVIASSRRNIFPVTDKDASLRGLITIDDIRDIMFRQELYKTVTVRELMRKPAYVITAVDDIRSAMKLFDESHLWNIPVVMDGVYKGFISKSTILEKYRETLINTSVG